MRYAPHTHNTKSIRDGIHYGALARMGLPEDTNVLDLSRFEREDYKLATWEESVETIDRLRQAIDTVLVSIDEARECMDAVDADKILVGFLNTLEAAAYPEKFARP